jgi:hypothetical protein
VTARDRIGAKLLELLRSESGIALPMAILATVIGLGLAAIPVMASMDTQGGDRHNQSSAAAYTAADSAVELAIQRQSKMSSKVTTSLPCVKKNGTKLEAVAKEASGWCPRVPTTGTESVGTGGFSYRVKPVSTSAISVVATGTSTAGGGTVNSRVLANATSSGGTSSTPTIFGTEGVIGVEYIYLDNGASITGNVGSNGYVQLVGGTEIKNCETIRVGTEFKKESWQSTPCTVTKGTKEYPPVVVPSENSNGRMFTAGGDTYYYSGGALAGCGAQSWQAQWCPTTKVLGLRNETTVTLGGTAPYVFCQLQIEGAGVLKIKAGVKVQIIFESPEKCGLSSGTTQLLINNGGKVEAEGASGNEMRAGFYFVGGSSASNVKLEGGASVTNFVMYGPKTSIEISNGASFRGAMLGKTITMHGGTWIKPEGSEFKPDENLPIEKTSTGGGTYSQGSYAECTSTVNETEPSTGC